MTTAIFHRPVLANLIAKRTLSARDASGLFISAPRRTGKSTLINEDVIPILKHEGAQVIYVDLWADRDHDPGDLISEAIREHLQKQESALLQWARRGGLDKVNVAGIHLDINKVGIGSGKTIAKALSELSDATRAMIVLVIDEAQHAITTEAGASTLYALKAARDQLNGSAHHGFRLIATGSNRDKLGVLVQGKDQAFLNATLIDLELLGDDYLRWEIDQYDGDFKPSLTVLKAGFHAAGHQPETLRKALNWLVFRSDVTAANVDTLFKQIMGTIMLTAKRDFVRQVNALPPLQAAVLVVMALMGTDYAPFRLHTLQKYQATCALLTNDDLKIDDSTIQYALESLRTKSLIWKSTRGIYAIEDSQHEQWLLEDYAKPIGS